MSDEALLREILDAQLEMVCRFRADGTILYANRAYARSLGLAPGDLTGRNLWAYVSGEDEAHVRRMVGQLSPTQPELTIENRFETADGPRWVLWRNHALQFDAEGQWLVAQSTGIDITERRLLEDQLGLMMDELNHRVKNTLMVVQAVAFQTFRTAGLPPAAVSAFNERLGAIAGAHDTLSRANWSGATFAQIVAQGLLICGGTDGRVTASGPEVHFPANATVSLVMVLHELATNAMKYGALAHEDGQVTVGWTLNETGDRVVIDWVESGGPRVTPPARTGFGSRLVHESVPRQLSGTVEMDFAEAGLRCRISIPLKGVD